MFSKDMKAFENKFIDLPMARQPPAKKRNLSRQQPRETGKKTCPWLESLSSGLMI